MFNLPTFIGNHRKLAEKKFFVSGNRILLSEQITLKYITENISVLHQTLWQWIKFKRQGKCNRWSPLLTLRLGIIRKLRKNQWQGVKTCNLALFREDFIAINGMDENYQGWGFEDSDLVVRLQNNHVKRKDGRYFVPVIHLWHPHNRHPISSANNLPACNQLSTLNLYVLTLVWTNTSLLLKKNHYKA